MQPSPEKPDVVLIGLGEVGMILAEVFRQQGLTMTLVSRDTPRSREAANALGMPLLTDPQAAVRGAALVLIAVPGDALLAVMLAMAPGLQAATLVVDLTSAAPADVEAAAALHPGGAQGYVDAAIMGAISLQAAATPLITAGPAAQRAAIVLASIGLNARAIANSAVGDAARTKLLRSIFFKGLDALMVESALAAEAMGLTDELLLQFDNFDRTPLRDHYAMYLTTHPLHASRRLTEMREAERELLRSGVASLTTAAALARYSRTVTLRDLAISNGSPPPETREAAMALRWLLDVELHEPAPAPSDLAAGQPG